MSRSSPVFYGWFVVAATFLVLFGGFGAVYSFGAFVLPLSNEFGVGRAGIASIFSTAVFMLFITGAFSGMLADRIGPRRVIAGGVVAIALGFAGAAMAREFIHILVCYGCGVGIGVGFVYVPAIGAVQHWFVRRRGLASGIAVTGIGIGTLVMPVVAGLLLETMSWREVFLALGALIFVLGTIAVCIIEADPAARGLAPDGGVFTGPNVSAAVTNERLRPILLSRPFVLFYCASAILSVPVFIPFVHLVASAEDLGVERAQAVAILGLIGLGSTAGRFIVGGFADRLGRRRALIGMLGE
ncbi:MAG: MFS transporter [Gammaproteobacteria bacterium]